MDQTRRRLRILLADDDPVHQFLTVTVLRDRGHEIDAVRTGRAAVAAVTRGGYQVVLMDLEMPELDGISATRQIRATPQHADLPIIAITARGGPDVRADCLVAGMTDFLQKPVSPQALVTAVEQAVAAPQPPAAEPGASSPVDLDGLRRMMQEAGIEAALDGIIEAFVREAPARMSELEAGAAAGDAARIRRAAHAYRSAATTLAAQALAALLHDVEQAGRQGDMRRAATLVPEIRAAHDAALAQIAAHRMQAAHD